MTALAITVCLHKPLQASAYVKPDTVAGLLCAQEALRRRLADRTAVNERSARQHAQEAAALKRAADAARTRVSQLESENRQQRLQLKVLYVFLQLKVLCIFLRVPIHSCLCNILLGAGLLGRRSRYG